MLEDGDNSVIKFLSPQNPYQHHLGLYQYSVVLHLWISGEAFS
ncbi:Putative uncharacterized protein [Moritella viscosa]|uniref:Uncharacterized protein n=1 Tax=Moritella viscosa TaxID=80854 RepID=A0A1L0AV20_9GAMM|nr:Putative uncharacterized protein [Moritella viscosa]SHO02460.1 Putative uncharacterized protein [Moritella viscosa]SHO02603.1 Putative uncharacterized protein [Moritella viscosa]SHO04525.1 Putative uncharacterized protein [Moritella viscosa]SHO19210.1 Putative uncharacterized protein [Moritella viscosa]